MTRAGIYSDLKCTLKRSFEYVRDVLKHCTLVPEYRKYTKIMTNLKSETD